MESNFDIVPMSSEYYLGALEVFNQGFLPKFRFVIESKVLRETLAHDYGFIREESTDREFVAVSDGKVLGHLVLLFRGQKDGRGEAHIGVTAALSRYGILSIPKALLMGRLLDHKLADGELYIDSVAVSSNARGMGVGSALMSYAENYAREKGMSVLSLRVMHENTRAKALYERLGFQVVKENRCRLMKKMGYSGYSDMIRKL